MKKTRKISMIPEFLRNRKTYMLTALVFTIIGVLSLSFAFFQFADDTDLTSSNTIMVETMNISDITKTFTVTYEGNNGLIKTGILNAGFSDIYKFKVTNNYNGSYPIGINWDVVRSTLNNQNTNYTLYTCTEANYTSATIDNVASLCTAISPSTDNYLPKTNEMHKLTSVDEITLNANETQYYIAKIVIDNTESGKSFNGAIRVKHRETHTLTLNLDGGEITCDTVADMKTGDTVVLPIPSKTGYVFEGWSIGEVDSVINHYTFTMGSMDTTLIASWTANIQTFMYNGTTGSDGSVQIFTAPQTGTYKVEAWGASGGTGTYRGGYGAYTYGEIYLEKDEELYVYVGGRGANISGCTGGAGGYNGGGNGGNDNNGCTAGQAGAGGGGATDIRYFSFIPTSDDLAWNSTNGLNSRIMIAAGGGGGGFSGAGGDAGGLIGYDANSALYSAGSQTSGNAFGIGQNGSNAAAGFSGGGGGYYGGKSIPGTTYPSGAGGSSYISGHIGCNAIASISDRLHTGGSIHFSNKYFTNTIMIDGTGYSWSDIKNALQLMPIYNGGSFVSDRGNSDNGVVKITFNSYDEKVNTTINNEINSIMLHADFSVSNNYQKFINPKTGTYAIEAWGAGGGTGTYRGGYGAYTYGEIYLEKDEELYVYVGGRGANISGCTGGAGGYNGGGNGGNDNNNCTAGQAGAGGGGATDIRYFNEIPSATNLAFNDPIGLNARIMVAGGGGGGGYQGAGGAAGGLEGYTTNSAANSGGTQYSGNSFGIGQNGSDAAAGFSGGGGGYYGGKTLSGTTYPSGSGGSSYISGHPGCIAINDLLQTTSPRNILIGCTSSSTDESCSYHLALTSRVVSNNKYFFDTLIIDGNGYAWTTVKSTEPTQMPNPNGGDYTVGIGNNQNGFARITLIE